MSLEKEAQPLTFADGEESDEEPKGPGECNKL